MYFTLAISAATRQACAALVTAAQGTDPRLMPIPGPVRLAWHAPDERAAVLHWGTDAPDGGPRDPKARPAAASHAGTIWIGAGVLCVRTGVARVDPVYLAEPPGAVVVSDRASWAAAVTGRLGDYDPMPRRPGAPGRPLIAGAPREPLAASGPGVAWPRLSCSAA
jgi:hypothetical protein